MKKIRSISKKIYNNLLALIILMLAWIIFIGKVNLSSIIVGAFVCILPIAIYPELFAKIIAPKAYKRLPFLLIFLLYLLFEVFLACFRMAYFSLNPKLNLKSSILAYEYKLKSSTSIFFLAAVITLTPGTLVLDIVESENKLYIHALDYFSKNKEDVISNVELMEKLLRRVFE